MIRDRLAAYYPCDTTHGRNLTDDYLGELPMDGGLASSATGKVRQCLTFASASSQYRSRSNDATIQRLRGVCCWVKFTTLAANMVIISKGSSTAADDQSLKLWYNHTGGLLSFTVGDNSTSTTVTTSGLTLAVDTWYFIRCWNDPTDMGIEVDGVTYGTAAGRTPLTETGILYFGRDSGGTYFNGQLDEIALFSTAPTKSDGAFFYAGGDGAQTPEPDSLPGPEGRAGSTNPWTPPTFAQADNGDVYVAHGKRRVQRFSGFGDFGSAGVPQPEAKPRITANGDGTIIGDLFAYTRFLDADGRVSSLSPPSDLKHVYGDSTGEITGATNASPIVVTSPSHGLTNGQRVGITGQTGLTSMNGEWFITVLTANTFSLNGSVGNGDWTASTPPTVSVVTKQNGSAGVNAVQSLSFTGTPAGGTFTVAFNGETTIPIAVTASAATIDAALEGLSTIGSGNVSCTGGPVNTTAVLVQFTGALATQPVNLLTASTDGLQSASLSMTVTTLQDGSPGADEVQELTLYGSPSGGTFTLTFVGQETGTIAFNADAATIQAALEALSNVAPGDVVVTGGALPGAAVAFSFSGAYANTALPLMTVDVDGLTGSGVSAVVVETTPGVLGSAMGTSGIIEYFRFDDPVTSQPPKVTYHGAITGTRITNNNTTSFSDGINDSAPYVWYTMGMASPPYIPTTITENDPRSTAVWIKVPVFNAAYYYNLYVFSGGWFSCLIRVLGTGVVQATINLNGSNATLEWPTPVTAGEWHLCVVTWDGNNAPYRFGMSVDGEPRITVMRAGTATVNGTLRLVVVPFAAEDHGIYVDEWCLASRVFSDADIDYMWNDGNGRFYPFADIGYGVREVQTLTVTGASHGQYALTFNSETVELAYNANAAAIQTALRTINTLETITTTGANPYAIAFPMALGDVALLAVNDDKLQYAMEETTPGSAIQNDMQQVAADGVPQSGTFTLSFPDVGPETTAALDWDITAAELKTALEALGTIDTVDVTGGPLALVAFTVEFTGTHATLDVDELVAASSLIGIPAPVVISMTTTGKEPQNELQDIIPDALVQSGVWTITGLFTTSSELDSDATAAEVQTALETIYGTGNISVTGGPLTVTRFTVEFKGAYASTDVDVLTVDASELSSGGWGLGASQIVYQDVEVPTDLRVVRRQVLRSLIGDASVFYIDIDTTDLTLTTFTSTKTDQDLLDVVAGDVVLIDANGVDQNLARHGEPPNWKRVAATYQNRVFYAVDYVERDGAAITNDDTDVTGLATDWPDVFEQRQFYGAENDQGYQIEAVDRDLQTAAFTDNEETAETTTDYTLRMALPDNQRIYHSWLTSVAAYPESVHPDETFAISLDARAGEMTALYSFDGRFFVAFQHQTYRYQFESNPAQFPDGDGTMAVAVPRGVINQRCVLFADDRAYCMDREGIYQFSGDAVQVISQAIKPLFSGTSGQRIWWQADQWFHGIYYPDARVLRWFVCLDSSPYPQHAICYSLDQKAWWTEHWPLAITSSCLGSTADGVRRVFLGTEGRRVFSPAGSHDGLRNPVSQTRGTVTTASIATLTDASATQFTSELVGVPVAIVSGTGVGQSRVITAVSGTTLSIDVPWTVRPATDSIYQIGGINYVARTGVFAHAPAETEQQSAALTWEPVEAAALLDLTIYTGMTLRAIAAAVTQRAANTWGFTATKDIAARTVNLTLERGYALQRFDKNAGPPDSPQYKAIQLSGTTNGEPVKVYGVALTGLQ